MRGFAVSVLREPPFATRRHEAAGTVGRESAEWAAGHGIAGTPAARLRLLRADPAGLAGRACPEAPVDRLRLLSDLITWLFAVDDACDEDGLGAAPARLAPTVARLLDVLDRHGGGAPPTPCAPGGPVGSALDDLCRRVRGHRHPDLLLRFVGQLRVYLLALLWEAANREHGRVPGIAEYVQMRRHTGGVHPSLTLTDLAVSGLPRAARRARPELLALDALTADLVCWCNDVFSWARERRRPADGHNLVTVIAGETGVDERAAVRAAADRFNRALAVYVDRESALLRTADAPTRRHLAVRRCWIRATYDWSITAARYA